MGTAEPRGDREQGLLVAQKESWESAPCPLGCRGGDELIFTGSDRLHGVPGTFRLVRCTTCALMRTNPRPTLAAMGRFYPDPYGPHQVALCKSSDTYPARLLRRLLRALRLDGTRELVPKIPPGEALEIGCATGSFLRKLRARGWRVRGVEPSPAAARAARAAGFDVHPGHIEDAPDPGAPLDLVVASHTLEHLHDVRESLTTLRRWSRKGAWLTCSLPDSSSWLFRRFQGAWYDLDLPRHLYHFTPDTLSNLLASTGWQVQRIGRQMTLNSLMGSLSYWAHDRRGPDSWISRKCRAYPESSSPLKWLALPIEATMKLLGESGRMVIWARAR